MQKNRSMPPQITQTSTSAIKYFAEDALAALDDIGDISGVEMRRFHENEHVEISPPTERVPSLAKLCYCIIENTRDWAKIVLCYPIEEQPETTVETPENDEKMTEQPGEEEEEPQFLGIRIPQWVLNLVGRKKTIEKEKKKALQDEEPESTEHVLTTSTQEILFTWTDSKGILKRLEELLQGINDLNFDRSKESRHSGATFARAEQRLLDAKMNLEKLISNVSTVALLEHLSSTPSEQPPIPEWELTKRTEQMDWQSQLIRMQEVAQSMAHSVRTSMIDFGWMPDQYGPFNDLIDEVMAQSEMPEGLVVHQTRIFEERLNALRSTIIDEDQRMAVLAGFRVFVKAHYYEVAHRTGVSPDAVDVGMILLQAN